MNGLPAFQDLQEDDFEDLLPEEKNLIQCGAHNEMYAEAFQRIVGYNLGAMKASITTRVIKKLIEAGIGGVTTSVTAARAAVVQLLNEQPYLRDEEPQRALLKIMYFQWQQRQQRSRSSSRASSRAPSRASNRSSTPMMTEVEEEDIDEKEFKKLFAAWNKSRKSKKPKKEQEPALLMLEDE